MSMPLVLLVEDDLPLADMLRAHLGADDYVNLLAVDGPLNTQKGDGDAATWLPPNKAYRCEYMARQVGVKFTYGLWVTQAERYTASQQESRG